MAIEVRNVVLDGVSDSCGSATLFDDAALLVAVAAIGDLG